MEKKKAKLKDWTVHSYTNGCYFLHGTIIEDEKQRGFIGKDVNTSYLIRIDFENKTAETKNTIYELE